MVPKTSFRPGNLLGDVWSQAHDLMNKNSEGESSNSFNKPLGACDAY